MSLLTPELLRRREQFQLLTARHVELFVATSAFSPALSPRRGRTPRCVLSHRTPSILRKFSPANHKPAATGNLTPKSSAHVRVQFPLPEGEGQGEGEHHTNFVPARNQGMGMNGKGIKTKPEGFSYPIPLPFIPLPSTLCALAPLR